MRVRIGNWAEKERVEDAKNGGVDTDAKGQGGDDDEGKARTLAIAGRQSE